MLGQHLELDPSEGRFEFRLPLCLLPVLPRLGGLSLSGVVAGVLGAVSSCVSSDTTCTHTHAVQGTNGGYF